MSIALQIKRLVDVVNDAWIKILVYGDAGTGKTTLVVTLPGRGLIISAEAGLLSLRKKAKNRPDIDMIGITTIEELDAVYDHLLSGKHEYEWAALDSISEIAEALLSDEKKKTKDPRQAYGAIIDRMGDLMRAFRDLPMHIYMASKEETYKEDATGREKFKPSMPGAKLGSAIPYLFDEVFRLSVVEDKETKEPVRWLQTQTDGRTAAKDRSGELDPFEPADFGEVFAKIVGAESTSTTEEIDQ